MPITLKTHTRLAKSQLHKQLQWIIPTTAISPALTVEVLSGSQAGTSTEINTSDFTVGPDPTNDVMLLDDEALGKEAHLACEPSMFGPLLTVKTLRDDLQIDGAVIQSGIKSAPERLPCAIDFNGILLRFQSTGSLERSHPQRKGQTIMRLLLLVAFSAFAAHLYITNLPGSSFILHSEPSIGASEPHGTVASERVVNALILKAGLSSQLQVDQLAAGTLSISGSLPPDKMEDWYEIRREIDEAASDAVIISDISEMQSLPQLPLIAAIELGPTPMLVLADGNKIGLGDPIDDNWIIRKIGSETLEIERDDETIVVSF
ncbi:hypothetical protein [uncultured Tateyamaria sp.]|uniref:SctD/MshK family protein n=1 Tax=uncultured Tateyamaria sp. TaxID=455651 RepID=UPI0026241A48|nr:hypothetical protein [uncultured Tateyamaria sp.]